VAHRAGIEEDNALLAFEGEESVVAGGDGDSRRAAKDNSPLQALNSTLLRRNRQILPLSHRIWRSGESSCLGSEFLVGWFLG
jgi:hypothetical protein